MISLKLEDIRPAMPPLMRFFGRLANDGKDPNTSRAWVAEVAPDNLRRVIQWLRPRVDYSESNSVGSRGVYRYYLLDEGKTYWVSDPRSWHRTERYYCRISGGELVKFDAEI